MISSLAIVSAPVFHSWPGESPLCRRSSSLYQEQKKGKGRERESYYYSKIRAAGGWKDELKEGLGKREI
jgi:hypothetical protein